MRIAILGMSLESVSFLPNESTIEDFERCAVRGDQIEARYRNTNTVVGGFIKILNQVGWEPVGIVHTQLGAAGPCSEDAFARYTNEIEEGLEKVAGEIDGVLLHVHGAMTTPTRTDPDADITHLVRKAIGPDMPLVMALDYHANLDERSILGVHGFFGYRRSPHTDMGETGERAASCLVKYIKGEIEPVLAIRKPPMMIPSIFSATNLRPLADVMEDARRLQETSDEYVDVSVFAGFSYADVPNCGFSVVVTANAQNKQSADEVADEFADKIWKLRRQIANPFHVYGLQEGVTAAMTKAKDAAKPIVILEHADRLNDSTYVLRELQKQGARNAAVPFLWDPEAAAEAVASGVGSIVELAVGGKSCDRAGGPVTLKGEVLWAGDLVYKVSGPMDNGNTINLGATAVINAGGIVVSITTYSKSAIDEDCFKAFGLNAIDFDIIVLRSKTHFRAVYEPLADEILVIDTPDWGPADLKTLPYQHVKTGDLYPFADRAER